MYHSITIGTKNTWDDWHLIPSSRPLFNPPAVKTNMIEIPGGDGVLDLTTALTGRPLYQNRTGSIEFYVQNGFKPWANLYSEIMGYLHGQRLQAILEDDPDYYYQGRFSVNAWKSDQQWSLITIDYDVEPFKYELDSAHENWLWDTFNFEKDVIRYYKNLPVSGSLAVTVIGTMVSVTPTIIASTTGMSVAYGGETYTLSKGANTIREIIIQAGENEFVFSGEGTITIEMLGGVL